MQKYLIIIALILMGLLLMACDDDAELRIRNRSNASIKAKVDNGTEFTIEAWSGWSRTYSEDTTVKVSYEGLYVYPDSVSRNVTRGLPTTLDINPDCGAIMINNDKTQDIVEIYISGHDATDWGHNLIVNPLSNGANRTWSLDAGKWDLKVIDNAGNSFYSMNQTITINETLNLDISGFSTHTKQNKKPGASKEQNQKSPRINN